MIGTFWMRTFAVAYWVLVGLFVYILAVFFAPNLNSPEVGAFLPVMLAFLAIFVAVALAATLWRGAAHRPRFWQAGIVPAVLFLLLNAPYVPPALARPSDVPGFASALPLLVATAVAVVAGILASREARTGQGATAPTPRALATLAVAVAATLAAVGTAALAAGGRTATAAEVGSTLILEARQTRFVQEDLSGTRGETLGLVIVNRDSYGHSFDIDALDVHVPLPPNASTLVALTLADAGSLEFYCAVPGHEGPMRGTITVR